MHRCLEGDRERRSGADAQLDPAAHRHVDPGGVADRRRRGGADVLTGQRESRTEAVDAGVEQGATAQRAEPVVVGPVEDEREGRVVGHEVTDLAAGDQFAKTLRSRVVRPHERLGEPASGRLGDREEPLGIRPGQRQRLLAQDVLAALEGPPDPVDVERTRQRDVDGINRRVGQHLEVRRHVVAIGDGSRRLGDDALPRQTEGRPQPEAMGARRGAEHSPSHDGVPLPSPRHGERMTIRSSVISRAA